MAACATAGVTTACVFASVLSCVAESMCGEHLVHGVVRVS